MEVLWKTTKGILNICFTLEIHLHDAFHGFWAGHGMGTATLEANILQQLTAIREEVLYEIFLYLQKNYDTLYKDRCIEILAAYGVEPRVIRLLQTYWVRITIFFLFLLVWSP